MAALSALGTIAGAGIAAYGAHQQGKAAQASAKYNAQLARQQADIVKEDAAENVSRRREDQRRALARIRAQYGVAGLAESGAPVDVFAETSSKFELELADMFTAAQRRATALENDARLSVFEGNSARTAGSLRSFSALARGGSRLGQQMFDFKQKGIGY